MSDETMTRRMMVARTVARALWAAIPHIEDWVIPRVGLRILLPKPGSIDVVRGSVYPLGVNGTTGLLTACLESGQS